jgi:hypothetical protein
MCTSIQTLLERANITILNQAMVMHGRPLPALAYSLIDQKDHVLYTE